MSEVVFVQLITTSENIYPHTESLIYKYEWLSTVNEWSGLKIFIYK